jgi:TDG/mug DNA glycosylase family protein
VDRDTVGAYEERGLDWAARRRPVRQAQARDFARRVADGEVRIDLGCGAGRYLGDLGGPVVGFDAAATMLRRCRQDFPTAPLVQGDLEALPFSRASFGGAWANMSYVHVPSVRVPLALAELHRVLRVGAPIDVQVLHGDYEGHALPEDDVGGRFFSSWRPDALLDVFAGAGFDVQACQVEQEVVRVRGERLRTLPDTVGQGMALLVVGLNPSLYAADAGVGFARPGNRFWPAALRAGIVSRDRDAVHALRHHGVGMTDLVKRPTTGAAELSRDEYAAGMRRVERLAHWLAPGAVCFVGLAGYRAVVDRRAGAGRQSAPLGGRPVYVMPSTSGANASSGLDALTDISAAPRRWRARRPDARACLDGPRSGRGAALACKFQEVGRGARGRRRGREPTDGAQDARGEASGMEL